MSSCPGRALLPLKAPHRSFERDLFRGLINDMIKKFVGAVPGIRKSVPAKIRTSVNYLMILLFSVGGAAAQGPTAVTPPPMVAPMVRIAPPSSQESDRYRIGPGDVLDIRVNISIPNPPQLSREAVRVEGNGMIRMPRIDDDIQAACKTEGELAREINERYQRYYRHPSVDVFVKEFNSKLVAVIGAVNSPSRFQLQRRVRLLELLAHANGPADRAGQTVNIVHAGGPSICQSPDSEQSGEEALTGLVSYKLSETLRGEEKANPYLVPGDIVTIPDADQIYVVGNVVAPRAVALREPMTVSRAIAMAGGIKQDTKSNRVRIVRQAPGGTTKTEIYIDLKAIEKRRAEDIALQANDIVDVPTSAGKSFLRSLLGTVVPAVSQLPVRVIP